MIALAYLWLLNVILIIDWARNRRPLFWLWALVAFGPIGAMAYIIYYYEQINFPIELATTIRKLTGKKVLRACPRCGTVAELKPHQDGRQLHFMCELCIERTFLEPHDATEVLNAAESIINNRTD